MFVSSTDKCNREKTSWGVVKRMCSRKMAVHSRILDRGQQLRLMDRISTSCLRHSQKRSFLPVGIGDASPLFSSGGVDADVRRTGRRHSNPEILSSNVPKARSGSYVHLKVRAPVPEVDLQGPGIVQPMVVERAVPSEYLLVPRH